MNQSAASRGSRTRFWLKRLSVVLFIFWLVLYLSIWLFSPMIARWQINQHIQPWQLRLSDTSSIRLNPFILQLSLADIQLLSTQSDKMLAGVTSGTIDIDAFALFSQAIRIEAFQLSGLNIDARRTADFIEIAGLRLASAANNADAAAAENPEGETPALADNADATASPWAFNAEQLTIDQLTLNIQDQDQPHQIELKHLQINSVDASVQSQRLALQLQLAVDNAPLNLTAEFSQQNGTGQVALNLSLEQLDLNRLAYLAQPTLTHLSGKLGLTLASNIQFDAQQLSVDAPQIQLTLDNIALGTPEIELTSSKLVETLQDFSLRQTATNNPSIESRFTLSNQDTLVKIADSDDRLVQFADFNLQNGKLQLTDQLAPDVSIEAMQFDSFIFSHKKTALTSTAANVDKQAATTALQPLLSVSKIDFKSLSFAQQHLSLDSITLAQLATDIVLDANHQLAGLVLPQTSAQPQTDDEKVAANDAASTASAKTASETETATEAASETATKAKSETEATAPFTFSLQHLTITDNSEISFSDNSVTPAFSQKVALEKFQVDSLDSRTPEQPTAFIGKLKMDAYSGVEFSGHIAPFAAKTNLDLTLAVNEYSLPAISPYLSGAMGFEMLSGQFDTKTHLTIIQDIIKGEAELSLRGLKLSDAEKADDLKSQSAMPLNSALGMLMDDKGNLQLTVPLSGDVSDPQFGVSSFIAVITKKAIMATAQTYLLNTFLPYANVLSVVLSASDYMLKVSFEDLPYAPGTTQLQAEQQTFAEQFIALLKDQPETQVKVCAVATADDLPQQPANWNDPAYVQQLKAISQLRGEQFKAWVVEKGGIESARLLLCQPQVDQDAKAKPRIKFEV